MPPKNTGKEKDISDEDEVLQAVILADSFNKRFKPLTVGKPRVRFSFSATYYYYYYYFEEEMGMLNVLAN